MEFHAFWNKAYSERTSFVSDPTTESTPVGVDWYLVEERDGVKLLGDQFGPFGSLLPVQLNNQTGRGFFRCAGAYVEPWFNFPSNNFQMNGTRQANGVPEGR